MFKYQKLGEKLYNASTLKEAKDISINILNVLYNDLENKDSYIYKLFEKDYYETVINFYSVTVDNKKIYYTQCPMCEKITKSKVEYFSKVKLDCNCCKNRLSIYNKYVNLVLSKNVILSTNIYAERDFKIKDLEEYMDDPEAYFKALKDFPVKIYLRSTDELIFYTKKHHGARVYSNNKVSIYNKDRYSRIDYMDKNLYDPIDLTESILSNYNKNSQKQVDNIDDMLSDIYQTTIKKSNKKHGEVKFPKDIKNMIIQKASTNSDQLYIDNKGDIHLLRVKNLFKDEPYIVRARYTKNNHKNIQLVQDKEVIKKIISNSKYKYSNLDIILERIFINDIAEIGPAGVKEIKEYLEKYTKNTKIEMIVKHPLFKEFPLNLQDLNSLKIYDGKKPYQVLGISPAGFKTIELLSTYNIFSYNYSKFIMVKQIVSYDQLLTAKGKAISPDYMNLVAAMFDNHFGNAFPDMYTLLENYNIDERQVFEYIMEIYKATYNKPLDIFNTWVDYLNMADLVGYNLENPILLFPKEIYVAHGQVLSLYNQVKTEIDNKKIKEILVNTNKRYSYKGKEYSIIAPKNAADIVEEGVVLRHCVKSYIEDVIRKKTNILFLRKNDDINKPFYTVEIKGDQIFQVRGFSNKDTTPSVDRFINEYKIKKNVL